jgi:tRNA-modifying protein YgfZ
MDAPIDWEKADGSATHLGSPASEFKAALETAILCPVGHFGLLRFLGADAAAFLQAQLTCDVSEVTETSARFGGYCSPKGRLLADFLLLRTSTGYWMHLPASMSVPLAERLRRFVLRSAVKIQSAPDWRAIGAAGPAAASVLHEAFGTVPGTPMGVVHDADRTLVRLTNEMFLIVAPATGLGDLWRTLAEKAMPAGTETWDWLQIRAGIPWIDRATQDQFVPQMVGLDAIGGVSFDKGCYPGQEIVARTRYLGDVKRHLYRGHVDGELPAADALVAGNDTLGTILLSAREPNGGSDFLAVVQDEGAEGPLRVGDSTGPSVSLSGQLHRSHAAAP